MNVELSMGYRVKRSRTPSEDERKRGIKRVMLAVDMLEASFVLRGAAGPGRTGIREIKKYVAHPGTVCLEDPFRRAKVAAIARNLKPRPVTRVDFGSIDRTMASIITETTVVTAEQKNTAEAWAQAVERELGLPPTKIKWKVFSAQHDGCFDPAEPQTIFLNPRIKVERIPEVVCHELGHRARHLRRWPDSERLVERDADDLLALLGAA